jgi:putative serine protease PepD
VPGRPDVPRLEDVLLEPAPLVTADPWDPPRPVDPVPAPAPSASAGGWSRRAVVAALAAVAILGGITGSLLTRALDGDGGDGDRVAGPAPIPRVLDPGGPGAGGSGPGGGAPSSPSPNVFNGFGNSVADVVAAVAPAVVSIQVEGSGGVGAGSGVILSSDGEVLTNAHVVEGATTIRVVVEGETEPRAARVVGSDPVADLALLSLDGPDGLPTIVLAEPFDVAVGDDVVAIGNALGLQGGPTVTRGIVSALDRSLEIPAGTLSGLIQTDASISSGNSGGPLVNVDGEVIGINTAVAAATGRGTSAENIGFAIAVDRIEPVLDALRGAAAGSATGTTPRLGVNGADPTDGTRGALVIAVAPGSAAAGAGLEIGDVIVKVGDNVVVDAASLAGAVRAHRPGELVEVVVLRNGRSQTFLVVLGTAD